MAEPEDVDDDDEDEEDFDEDVSALVSSQFPPTSDPTLAALFHVCGPPNNLCTLYRYKQIHVYC